MVEISSQGINNYISQQTVPQVTEQPSTRAEQAQENNAAERKVDKKIEVRGVILDISREARKLFKADLNNEVLEEILISRRSKLSLHAAIMGAKNYQETVTDKISEMIELSQEDQIKVHAEQIAAA